MQQLAKMQMETLTHQSWQILAETLYQQDDFQVQYLQIPVYIVKLALKIEHIHGRCYWNQTLCLATKGKSPKLCMFVWTVTGKLTKVYKPHPILVCAIA